jgi:serine/threonine protein kinase
VAIPRSLGRYEVIELLDHEGMGALYRARDPRIGRSVAIKQLRPQFNTPELRERFAREAAAAGGLSHANIVTVYDVGEQDGLPFIAMEFVQGETFADLVKLRPPLALPRKIALTEEVCAGLAHAHEAGIVHRDIKPANLIVGPEGIVKILDFGVAKLPAGGTTAPGAVVGTLNYLSPEQIAGTGVDARADIFSLGAVLYELLSHRQAFPGRNPADVFQKILRGAPTPLPDVVPGIDARLVELVQCALEKDPDQRVQDASTFQQELAIVRLSLLAAESPRPVPRRTAAHAPSAALQTPPPLTAENQVSRQADREALSAKREAQILDHLATAQHAFDSRDYDTAIESCKQVLLLDENDARAMDLLDRVHAAIDEQQERDRLVEVERQQQASIRLAIEEARRRFAAGQHEAAIQSLERFDPSSMPLLADALRELRHEFGEIQEQRRLQAERAEHQRTLQKLLEEGRVALQQQRIDEAQRLLDGLRQLDRDAPETTTLADLVAAAREAARLNAQIENALRNFDEALGREALSDAANTLDTVVVFAADDPRVRAARKRLDVARAALAARQAAEAKRLEGERQLELAAAHLEKGDLTAAADGLALATTALTRQHAGVVTLAERLQKATDERAAAEAAERRKQEVAGLVESASRRVTSAGSQLEELLLALRDVDRALSLSPDNPDAGSLKATIEASLAALREAARVKAVINNARTRFANGKHQAAIRLLEDYQPAHPEIQAALTGLRDSLAKIEEEKRLERERIEKEQRVTQLLDSARASLGNHELDAAMSALASAADIDANAPGLAALRDRVRQEQDAARLNAEVEHLLTQVDGHLASDDLSGARAALESAAPEVATHARVQAAAQRLEKAAAARAAAEARLREAEERYRAAATSFENGDVEAAMTSVTAALSANPKHELAQALSKQVAAALEERAAAEETHRKRQAVEDLVAAASAHLRDVDVEGDHLTLAMQNITEALALDPTHERALAVKAEVDSSLLTQRQARAAIRNARNRFSAGKHRAAIQLLEGVDPAVQPLVAATLTELRDALNEIEERRRREKEATGDATVVIPMPVIEASARQPGATERASGAVPDAVAPGVPTGTRARIWVWGAAAAVLFLLILIVLYRMRLH